MKKLSACVVAGLGMVILATASLSGQNGEFKPFEVQASQITIVP